MDCFRNTPSRRRRVLRGTTPDGYFTHPWFGSLDLPDQILVAMRELVESSEEVSDHVQRAVSKLQYKAFRYRDEHWIPIAQDGRSAEVVAC